MEAPWRQCEGQVADGSFPLLQYLGGSDHSAVFLTDLGQQESQRAAIKLISAISHTAELELARWEWAAKLSHPHLIRLIQMGRCHLANSDLLYLVMEYAQESLSQVLPQRALTPAESQEMLVALLDVLRYLHSKELVHGHLRPSNIMAVDDQLRISSDRLYRIGELATSRGEPSKYDAPEIQSAGILPAADVWSLGVTLVESLTQLPPVPYVNEALPLAKTLPMPFREIAYHCLQSDPRRRWTIDDIRTRLQLGPPIVNQQPTVRPSKRLTKLRYIAPIAIGAALLALFAAPTLRNRSQARPTTSPPKALEQAETKTAPGGIVWGGAVSRVLPDVPQSARDTIRGTVRVTVKVAVDPSGNVTAASFKSPGPSKYFANLALQAARGWKFKAPIIDGRDIPSEWNLQFQFERTATRVVPVQAVNVSAGER